MNNLTAHDLADDLGVSVELIGAYVDQLVDIDGADAVIDVPTGVLTADAETVIRRQVADDSADGCPECGPGAGCGHPAT